MNSSKNTTSRVPGSVYAGIAMISAATLMQEVVLTRVFSFTIWYHLAYMTISTALLGFGSAGSLLSGVRSLSRIRPGALATASSVLAGVSLLGVAIVLGPRPLDPLRLVSEPVAFSIDLFVYYTVIAVPFLLAGIAIVSPLRAYPDAVNRLYGADLAGAGVGCLGAVFALQYLTAEMSLVVCALVFIGGGVCYADRTRVTVAASVVAALVIALSGWYVRTVEFLPAASKAMGVALREPGTKMLYTKWSPVNRVDVYETANRLFTYWAGIGRSVNYSGEVPEGLSLQYDAHNGSAIYRMHEPSAFKLLDTHLLGLPYVVEPAQQVLVVGVGGGIDIVNAFHHGAKQVTGVELQPVTLSLLTRDQQIRDWTGDFFNRPDLTLVPGEGRHFVRAQTRKFDLIQQTATDTFSAQTTGAYVLAESYLYTVGAMRDYLNRLNDDGMLAVVIGELYYEGRMDLPPLISRLALTAREALARNGAADPADHIVVISQVSMTSALPSWVAPERAGTEDGASHIVHSLLVKKSAFQKTQIDRVTAYAHANGFRVLAAPQSETPGSVGELLQASQQKRAEMIASQSFKLGPVTDDRPFFFHVLPWGSVLTGERTIWNFPGSTTGQLILLIMLVQALLLGAVLILLPLVRQVRQGVLTRRAAIGSTVYFSSLGIGFMFIEISFVQKYVLLLGYPTYSLSVTVFSLLAFAGLGAYLSARFWVRARRFYVVLLASTAVLIVAEIAVLPFVRDAFLFAPLPIRFLVTIALQFPLGTCLGMYFPTGVELLRRYSADLIPWAWAVNGVASVVSLVLAVILGMSIGFSGVAALAALVYVGGTTVYLATVVPVSRNERG